MRRLTGRAIAARGANVAEDELARFRVHSAELMPVKHVQKLQAQLTVALSVSLNRFQGREVFAKIPEPSNLWEAIRRVAQRLWRGVGEWRSRS